MGYDMFWRDDSGEQDERSYFRLNIWGMREARAELVEAGVAVEAETPLYPRPDEFGLSDWPDDEVEWPEGSRERAFIAAESSHLRRGVTGDRVGIPTWKLGSNDGWIVTPGEITTSIAVTDALKPGWRNELSDYVLDFVEWMEEAARHGGFEVD